MTDKEKLKSVFLEIGLKEGSPGDSLPSDFFEVEDSVVVRSSGGRLSSYLMFKFDSDGGFCRCNPEEQTTGVK